MGRFDDYKFRCSALGKIISKSGKLTDGIKTYLQELFIGEIYGVRKEAYGKALEKGVFCEEDGISMLNQTLLNGQLIVKNKERKSNDFIHGECDVFKNGTVYDIKNAFTLFSFGKAELTHEYEWQLVGYAWLWNADSATLYYCINDMPEHMLEDEKRKLFYTNKWLYLTEESPNYIEACNELESAHKYGHMPIEDRFKFWEVEVNKTRFEQIQNAAIVARKYLNELWDEHQYQIAKNRAAMGLNSVLIASHEDGVK